MANNIQRATIAIILNGEIPDDLFSFLGLLWAERLVLMTKEWVVMTESLTLFE